MRMNLVLSILGVLIALPLTPGWALPSNSYEGGPGSHDAEARPAAELDLGIAVLDYRD